ncbi:MAG: NAD(P)H-quinone oxidoreductase [Algicola sp.]|nr:NAD(P)H-quinone oxidoreductase [Algicola sp.]
MKFIDIPEFGNPSVLTFSATDIPVVKADQLLVKVKAIGVNRADTLQRQGKYPPPKGESTILGLEMCGEVVEAQDSQWRGKKVFGLVAGGAYAEYCVLNTEHAFVLPDTMTPEQGAAIAEVFLTAYQSLFAIGDLQAGQTVLIHAGASGVGTAAIQLAKNAGAKVVVTVGSEQKKAFCEQLGADLAINYHEQDFVSVIKEQVKGGVNLVIDCVAGDYIHRDINCLAMDGKIVVLAIMGGRFVELLDIAKMMGKRATIQASTLRNRSDEYKSDLIEQLQQRFGAALAGGQIKPIIDSVFDWQDVAAAHQYIEDNKNMGKVVLRVG